MRYDHFSMLPERAFQPRNGRQSMTLEGGGSGGGGPQTTYTSNVPEWLRPQTEALLGAGTQEYFQTRDVGGTPDRYVNVYNPDTGTNESRLIKGTPAKKEIVGVKPYKPFSGRAEDYVAGFNPAQQQVFEEGAGLTTDDMAYGQASDITRGTAGRSLGYGQQALGFGQQAAGYGGLYEQMATDPMAMQAYMSPYIQQVVERQKLAAIEDAQRANLGANLGAARQGTYGGARQTLAQSQREAALEKQLGDIQAMGLQSAFDKAQQAQQFGITTGLQGLQTGIQGAQTGLQGLDLTGKMGAQLGNIATSQQAANLQRLEFQRSLGAEQRAREQAIIDQAVQNYALAQEAPYQRLAQYSGLIRGYATPTVTTESYRAAPNPGQTIAGLGTTLYGAAMPGKKKGGVIEEGIDTLAIKKAKRKKVAK